MTIPTKDITQINKEFLEEELKMKKSTRIAYITGFFSIISAIIGAYFGAYFESKNITTSDLYDYPKIVSLQSSYEDLVEKYEVLEKDYKYLLNSHIPVTDTTSLESISNSDELEIDEIINRMNEFRDYTGKFPDLEIDSYEIELLYKLFLSEEYYKYKNIILAFEKYNINCEELSINEYLLELWDLEILWAYYNIQENIENNESKKYSFNDYKMSKIDTLNYGTAGMNYRNDTYEFIYKDMKQRINKIVRKMKRNSLPITLYE